MAKPIQEVTLIVAGAGSRGTAYANHAAKLGAKVVGVAEPRAFYRNRMIKRHNIPPENAFTTWEDMAGRERFADAVVIATQDRMHVEPAVAFANRGYDMLLEKPMAPTEEGCRRIVQAATDNDIAFAVCHVLRYTDYTQQARGLIDSGAIGDVVGLQHIERVSYWHQAHSFVRGEWRNEAESSFMLLAKSCHDLDWIRYIMGAECRRVGSFGSLYHFRPEQAPPGAGERCTDCPVEEACPYSAIKIYVRDRVRKGHLGWPTVKLTPEVTEENVIEALRTGPWGRCVYHCDNDVVDNQVVNMEFDGGRTASFTMTAFTLQGGRQTTIFGTHGNITIDGTSVTHHDFLSNESRDVASEMIDGTIAGGHGGGDTRLIERFLETLTTGDRSRILSGPRETLESHLMVFAAERARRNGSTEEVKI